MTNEIIKAINGKSTDYGTFYVNNFEKIYEFTSNVEGVKTDTYIKDFNNELDRIRFSVIFSDFTNIYPIGMGSKSNIVIKPEQTVSIDESILKAIVQKNQVPVLNAGFIVRNEDEIQKFLKTIEPLVASQRAILHNSRILIGLTNKKHPDGDNGKVWDMFRVEPNSPIGNWLSIENSKKQNSTLLDFNPESLKNKNEIFEITIPYLKGISFNELDLILNDNQDLISSFRTNLKSVVDKSKINGKSIEEMKNDIIRPEIEMLSHRFRKIKNIHGLKVAGTTLSTITLGLVGYSTMGIGSIISGFLGAGGLGLLVKQEAEYHKEIAELEKNPFYLMWKFKNEK